MMPQTVSCQTSMGVMENGQSLSGRPESTTPSR